LYLYFLVYYISFKVKMASELVLIARLIMATLLGSSVGFEREKRGKSAGLRTYMLVSLGSCLITIISISFAHDPARIAASIITGIGFLGGGAIIARRGSVKGITTAAGLWVMAAVGLGVGLGYYLLSVVTTTLVYLILKLSVYERGKW
jgi:putative Mg2+ transporter-C (MgtC) family protein